MVNIWEFAWDQPTCLPAACGTVAYCGPRGALPNGAGAGEAPDEKVALVAPVGRLSCQIISKNARIFLNKHFIERTINYQNYMFTLGIYH